MEIKLIRRDDKYDKKKKKIGLYVLSLLSWTNLNENLKYIFI